MTDSNELTEIPSTSRLYSNLSLYWSKDQPTVCTPLYNWSYIKTLDFLVSLIFIIWTWIVTALKKESILFPISHFYIEIIIEDFVLPFISTNGVKANISERSQVDLYNVNKNTHDLEAYDREVRTTVWYVFSLDWNPPLLFDSTGDNKSLSKAAVDLYDTNKNMHDSEAYSREKIKKGLIYMVTLVWIEIHPSFHSTGDDKSLSKAEVDFEIL